MGSFINFRCWLLKKLPRYIISKSILFVINYKMSPIFKCLICRKDIERSTKSFWKKKGHLLCSNCLYEMEKK